MKDTFFYLSTCDTCRRIVGELDLPEEIRLQDIKTEPLTREQLHELKDLAGSYEALFSKRARLYKERNLKEKALDESDFRDLLLEHYTFLKRPVLVVSGKIFVGNSRNTVAAAREYLQP
ncbi:arsenate reductase family protein [Muriicola marianensis]|uniref:Arsenate reductase n=1 Tax=Muriicola marianensis TaxID=1324801 RepID=A0ABQ1R152_9FLAO|nr:ArsC/Spx/MgsR family protein [Muriicola marianensis]GGD51622.1 arsenate reductase [Muriicola marianensis]